MKVSNMESSRGNLVPNQFIIKDAIIKNPKDKRCKLTGTMFQSYASNIVFKTSTKTYIDKYRWNYSRTTGKYRNDFLGENMQETQKKIHSGEYELVELN